MNFSYFFIILVLCKIFSNVVECKPLPTSLKGLSTEMNQNVFTKTIKHRLFCQDFQNINELGQESQLLHALKKLVDVDELISEVSKKYHNNKQVSYALKLLLKLKAKQMESSKKNLQHTIDHLDRMIHALNLMLFTKWDDKRTNLEIRAVGSNSSFSKMNISNHGNFHSQMKKILSTGGFVFLIFATASDVCVVTGGTFCVAVYLAGTCGIVIWLNSIYNIALNIG